MKSLSNRSKRRKIREDINIIFETFEAETFRLETTENTIVKPRIVNGEHNSLSTPNSKITTEDLSIPYSKQFHINPCNQINQNFKFIQNTSVQSIPEETYIQSIGSIIDETESFKNNLANWSLENNVKHKTLNSHLLLLRDHKCFSGLPKSSRTLLGTPRLPDTSIRNVYPGNYYHFGLAFGIERFFKFSNINADSYDKIFVAVGVDGLPLSKSSGSQFWPILAYIYGPNPKLSCTSAVFCVGLYHGYSKPKESDDFMSEFYSEILIYLPMV